MMTHACKFGFLLAISLSSFLLWPGSTLSQVKVDVFRNYATTSGGGAPYSDLVGTLFSPQVRFGTDTGFFWHPFGLTDFGADMTGTISVPTTDTHQFSLISDDGSLFFLNGALNVDYGGPSPTLNYVDGQPVTLTAGVEYPFEIQFFECCGGHSGVDLYYKDAAGNHALVPTGFLATRAVPEPGTFLMLIGVAIAGARFAYRLGIPRRLARRSKLRHPFNGG